MTKDEVAELIEAMPQGLDPDDFILKLINWAVDIEREACAKVCENMERNGAWITKQEAAGTIRSRGIDGATVGEVGVWGEKPPVKTYCGGKPNYVDAVNMSQECVDETEKGIHKSA